MDSKRRNSTSAASSQNTTTPTFEDQIKECCERVNLEAVLKEFSDQDEFIYIPNFVPQEILDSVLLPEVEKSRQFIHRNYIPLHKKGGSISSFTIHQQAPSLSTLYRSRPFINFISKLTKRDNQLFVCPDDDPHSVALYYYTEPGDHIGFHYDSSFYKGVRYTLLLGLIDKASCKLVCNLYTSITYIVLIHSLLQENPSRKPETVNIKVAPGALVVFNGDKVWHAVTPLGPHEERVVLSMEYVTNQDMGVVGKAISNVKDAVTYFGIGSFLGKYEGYNQEGSSSVEKTNAKPVEEDPKKRSTIIAFVNKLSGGQRGKEVLPQLRQLLGESNVFDLNEMGGPEPGLLQHKENPNLRVLACGGDGTVRWVIQGILSVGFKKIPPLCVLPLGTGNDLSRMFGWGSGYKGEDLSTIIPLMYKAVSRPIDLWLCTLTPWNPETGEQHTRQENSQVMFNYLNLGFDPQVALDFHSLRLSRPDLFKARFVNKCWYLYYAVGNLLRKDTPYLSDSVQLTIDGNRVEIPDDVKTLVILNFIYYQAGADIWGPDEDPENSPKIDDGVLEVVGINGAMHEAMIRLYLSPGIRIGRGKEIQVKIMKAVDMPMGVDGEPFTQPPSIVTIRHFGQVDCLNNPEAFA